MPHTLLASKAHDVTEATAIAWESPRRWAGVFSRVYCVLLSDADEASREEEARTLGIDRAALAGLAALVGGDDSRCLAEAVRVLGARDASAIDSEPWFARIKAMLKLDVDDRTELET